MFLRRRSVWWLLAPMLAGSACGNHPSTPLRDGAVDDGTASDSGIVATALTSFVFSRAANPGLSADVVATISGTKIDAAVPFGTDLRALVATFGPPATNVTVDGVPQVSGTTANDFRTPMHYVLTAADDSTVVYAVHVTVAFRAALEIPACVHPTSAAAGDLNGDDKPDLVVTCLSQNAPVIGVYLNTTPAGASVPTFARADVSSLGADYSAAIVDLTGDGKRDVVAVTYGENKLEVFVNTTAQGATTPTFGPRLDVLVQSGPQFVMATDLNADGKPDVVVANRYEFTFSVFINTTAAQASTVSLATRADFNLGFPASPVSIASGDINGDGKPDLAVAELGLDEVSVLLNTTAAAATTPTFSAISNFATGVRTSSVVLADINGDAKPDMAATSYVANALSIFLNTTATNATAPTFASKVDFQTDTAPRALTIDDFDGNGKPDFALANEAANSASVMLNTTPTSGTSPTVTPRLDAVTGFYPQSIATTDLDGDGKRDLVIANMYSDSISILMGAP